MASVVIAIDWRITDIVQLPRPQVPEPQNTAIDGMASNYGILDSAISGIVDSVLIEIARV